MSELNKKPGSKITRRQFLQLSAAAAGALALSGCQTAPETEAAPAQAPAESGPVQLDQTYVWLCAVTGVSFWIDGRKGLEAARKSFGVKTEFLGPQEYDAAQQLKILDDLIGRKPAGIMIFPADVASLSDTMKRAMKENIPVICVNSDVTDQSARYGFVGPDNRGVGRTGGQIVVDILKGKGNVAIMRPVRHCAKSLAPLESLRHWLGAESS